MALFPIFPMVYWIPTMGSCFRFVWNASLCIPRSCCFQSDAEERILWRPYEQ
jgi:hypothetical protein